MGFADCVKIVIEKYVRLLLRSIKANLVKTSFHKVLSNMKRANAVVVTVKIFRRPLPYFLNSLHSNIRCKTSEPQQLLLNNLLCVAFKYFDLLSN